jgi:excisionase family DNA binding protein
VTESPYLTSGEVAEHLRCSDRTVRTLIAEGKLRAIRLNRRYWRIRRDWLAEFERAQSKAA